MSLLLFFTYLKSLSSFMKNAKVDNGSIIQSDFSDDPTEQLDIVHSKRLLNEGIDKVLSETFSHAEETARANTKKNSQKNSFKKT